MISQKRQKELHQRLDSERLIKREVLRVFGHRCAIDGCGVYTEVVHEIIPRSRGKKSLIFQNRMAICNEHHDIEHHFGSSPQRIKSLQEQRKKYLISIDREEYV